jgi:hypothetical protein
MTSEALSALNIHETQPIERRLKANWLRHVILGGKDGVVNILGIVLGVIASGGRGASYAMPGSPVTGAAAVWSCSSSAPLQPRSASPSVLCSSPHRGERSRSSTTKEFP